MYIATAAGRQQDLKVHGWKNTDSFYKNISFILQEYY
jgi:hypothetical protein